ncbi:unnamed protein product [Clonostachys rosea f. rosea IK726]|uniref:Uncharacterized protein n=1 Tax=Clonostachys rosea f. rosea IK726 TaxID=1349383 RepID=A0ACA9TY64_BIOOC|nr:unnamed protein product [Clonostachys rosea f. rosea IK726]
MSCLVPSLAFEVQCHVNLRSWFAQKGNSSNLLNFTLIILTDISSQYKAMFKRIPVSQNIDSPIFSLI